MSIEMRWAVIGYKRECFSEEFITNRPMDFYEDESQLSEDYDFYIYASDGYKNPCLKYVNSDSWGFESELSFLGSLQNYAGDDDFRLKHLRRMFGAEEEDDTFYHPFNLSDAFAYLTNKKLNVEAARFNGDETVSEIIKWFRDVAKQNHEIQNGNAIIVYEGSDIQKAFELANEVREWFGIEVDALVPYCYGADSEHIDISFWWYDANAEISILQAQWYQYYRAKLAYASGDQELDMDDYCDLVWRTWRYICNVQTKIDLCLKSDASDVKTGKSFLDGFYKYIKTIELLTYYSVLPEKDKSKNYLFTVSAMLADELSRLASGGKESGIPLYYFWGEFMGFDGHNMDITMAAKGDNEHIIYDVFSKDYTVLLKAAKEINERVVKEDSTV